MNLKKKKNMIILFKKKKKRHAMEYSREKEEKNPLLLSNTIYRRSSFKLPYLFQDFRKKKKKYNKIQIYCLNKMPYS